MFGNDPYKGENTNTNNQYAKFRARGRYNATGRRSYVTTIWRNTEEEAQEDLKLYGEGRYTDLEIVRADHRCRTCNTISVGEFCSLNCAAICIKEVGTNR